MILSNKDSFFLQNKTQPYQSILFAWEILALQLNNHWHHSVHEITQFWGIVWLYV